MNNAEMEMAMAMGIAIGMEMATVKQQRGSNSNWEGMLKRWSPEPTHHRPAPSGGTQDDRPAPQWRGAAKKWFMTHPQVPGYDIADRVFHIACGFTIPEFQSEDEYSEDEDRLNEAEGRDKDGDGDGDGDDDGDRLNEAEDRHKDGDDDVDDDRLNEAVDRQDGDDDVDDADDDMYDEDDDMYGDMPGEDDKDDDDEGLLDELQAYVELVDVPKILHSTGHLSQFIHHVLFKNHANLRAKGAEVVTTMVQNNPTSQQLVIQLNGLYPLLYNITSDPDATSRTKALGAISALIRNNKPGITAFRLDDGYAKLRDALSKETESVMFQREALNLIQYLLHENSLDCNIVIELGLPSIVMPLASSDDAEVREAALRVLHVLTRDEEGGNSVKLVQE